jgi:phage gp29-like protein
MADSTKVQDISQAIPPMPGKGQIVTDQALYLSQISLYRNSLAFGGMRNPTAIWAMMVYNNYQAMGLYRELEEKDEDVANALDTLRLDVLGRDRDVVAADDSQAALDVKEFVEDQIAQMPDFHSVLDCILDAPGYGFSVQEMIFDTSEGQASLVGINDCPQELFLFGNRFQPQIGQLQFLDQRWASDGVPVPEEKFIVFTHRMRGRNRMGRPLLKSVFWASWFKRNVQRLWMQYAEKGPGTAVVRYNDSDNASERQKAVEAAQAIIDNVAIAVPTSFNIELDLLKVARSQDPAVYEHFFRTMQYSIARKILGETLTSFGNEGGTGARAQGQVHADTLQKRTVELCRAVASVVNRQMIRPLVLWNFGPDAPMAKWGFDIEEEEDLTGRIIVDQGLQKMGFPITKKYVVETYGMPLPEAGDDVLKPAPGPAPLGAPTPGGGQTDTDPDDDANKNPDGSPQSEFGEPGTGAIVSREQKQFDKLFSQLQGESVEVYRKRITDIAEGFAAAGVK